MNYSVIFEVLCSERSAFILWSEVSCRCVFPGHCFCFQRKDGKRFRAGRPLEEMLAPSLLKVGPGQHEESDK